MRTTFMFIPTLLMSLTTLSANVEVELETLRSNAVSGDVKAQRTLAFHYRDGTGVTKDDAKALKWAHRAADGGDAEAMPDAVKARSLAKRAAELGNPAGLVFLGKLQFQVGDLDSAKANWTKASKLNENLYILCNPAVATPVLQLITAADLKDFWRSDHYGALSKGVLSRPAFIIPNSDPKS